MTKLGVKSPNRLKAVGLPTPLGRKIGMLPLVVSIPIGGGASITPCFRGPLGRANMFIMSRGSLSRARRYGMVKLGAFTNMTCSARTPASSHRPTYMANKKYIA